MIKKIKGILSDFQGLKVVYEEKNMFNVKLDEYKQEDYVAYIEEITSGKIDIDANGRKVKTTNVVIYFCTFFELETDADKREDTRELIESLYVSRFVDKMKNDVDSFALSYPLAIYDANEVGVQLSFELKEIMC